MLEDGVDWRVGSGSEISVSIDWWLPKRAMFSQGKILQKSYACLSRLVEDDRLIWACDKTSEYTIQSGYKTLIGQHITDNNVTNTIEIYKKIWQQKIHSKIRITSRHILHNHSAFTNMSKVRVVSRVYNTYAAMVWSCSRILITLWSIWHTAKQDQMISRWLPSKGQNVKVNFDCV